MGLIFLDSPGKSFRFLLLICTFAGVCFCAINLFLIQRDRQNLKEDLVELSRIKYGLFSVDEWKQILARIISKKVEELNFSPDQRVEIRSKVSAFLTKTISEMEERFYEEKSESLSGWLKIGVASLTGMFDTMKKDVPIFTEQILDFLNDPGNRDKVKGYIIEKLSEYTDKTFSKIDYTEHNRILAQYNFGDRNKTIAGLQSEIAAADHDSRLYLIVLFVLILFSCLMILMPSSGSNFEFLLYTLICFCLLGAGLLLPMIEIDARIEDLSFTLLGERVSFTDQVLYYKSKSILEVVRLMLHQGKMDVMAVGFLVLLFSVLFPIAKLLASLVFVYHPSSQNSRFIRFMVFRTGKWSMADVMVVATFMSYIGFSGILSEQLNQLEGLTSKVDILTTNKSSLQIGFFLFTSFAIMSLLVSQRLQYKKPVSV
jgi:hypothetical protein